VAAPFLGSLSGRGLKAAEASPPKRIIAMFTHGGSITTRFFPDRSHGALTPEDLQGTTLQHLAPYIDKLLIPRGIRAMNEWTTDMTRGQGNDYLTQVAGSYFTCQPVTPNSNDPFSFDSATKFQAKPIGPSLDHVMAQQLSPDGTPLFLRVGNHNNSPQSQTSYSAAETPFNGLGRPADVYSLLTGLFVDGEPTNPDSYAANRGKSVIDLVRDDLETLERFDMSQSDKLKLEAWKDLLDRTTTVMASAQCSADVANVLGVTQANVDAAGMAGLGTDVLTTAITDTLDGADIYSAVAVLAAICNANPVIFLKYPFGYVYRGLGINTDAESLNHRVGNAGLSGTCIEGVIEMLLKIDDYSCKKFAKLVGMLDGIPEEGGGTVLDSTAAVWFQQFSDGCAHNLNNLPIVQAGSAGGYFKTGWTINVENGSETLTKGKSDVVCAAAPETVNCSAQETGTDPSLANAPINKYYCNLMNALGVKAGSDGYAAVGGTEEVTKFGMYDRTEDFVGGGTNPSMIHDPGAFEDLKAT
jgi:hypothetical protein